MKKKQTVVIVEDNLDSLEFLEYSFKKVGFDTICFGDSTVAFKFLAQNKVDAIITDWMMPEIDGCQLVEKLKDSVNGRSLKYLVSCISDRFYIEEALDTGIDGFMSKPIRVKKLIDAICGSLTPCYCNNEKRISIDY